MEFIIGNGTIISDELIANGAVLVRDGRIAYVGKEADMPRATSLNRIDAKGGYIAPGLIDIHIHGAGGADIIEGTNEAISRISAYCARGGATGFLPSTVTASKEKTLQVAKVVAKFSGCQGAKVLGIHFEGPYLNQKKKGAQFGDEIRPVDLRELDSLYQVLGSMMRLVTLAPEVSGAEKAIEWLVDRKIKVSAGHSAATFEQAIDAFRRGVSQATHTYNGMNSLHHREPGLLGATMISEGAYAQLIADGVHVHPAAMEVLYRVKGPKGIILITDAVQAAGLPDGDYVLGDLQIEVKEGTARLLDGTLAGSTLTMIQAVKNVMRFLSIPMVDAFRMGSETPALSLGLSNKGWIREGNDADLLILTPELTVQQTIVEGTTVYQQSTGR